MQRKNRSWLASSNPGTLNTGWCGRGNPLINSIAKNAVNAATSTNTSNVIGINTGQLL